MWAVLELMLVRGEKQKHGYGAGAVMKVATVEFTGGGLCSELQTQSVIQQETLHSSTAVLSYS